MIFDPGTRFFMPLAPQGPLGQKTIRRFGHAKHTENFSPQGKLMRDQGISSLRSLGRTETNLMPDVFVA